MYIGNLDWSSWLSASRGGYPVPSHGGVYRIRITTQDGAPIEIPRALARDCSGIVYIGRSQNLQHRIGNLWWIGEENIEGHGHHHPLIRTWHFYGLNRIGSRQLLQVSWRAVPDHRAEEQRLINEYKRQFGDIPLGNCCTAGDVPNKLLHATCEDARA